MDSARSQPGEWRLAGTACVLVLLLPSLAAPARSDILAEFTADPAAAQAALSLARRAFDEYVLHRERVPR